MTSKRTWTREEDSILVETMRTEKISKENAYMRATVNLRKKGYLRSNNACRIRYSVHLHPVKKVVDNNFNEKIAQYKRLCEASLKSTNAFIKDIRILKDFINTIK